jgi:hypothetical protein
MKARMGACLILALTLAISVACEGGTSGSVTNSRRSCNAGWGSGSCKGTYGKLSGTYSEDIENDSISSNEAIDVQVQVSVEEGVIRVSVESPDGEEYSAQATPGNPAVLVGVAEGAFEEFDVRFEAVDGEARGVSWEIAYQAR